MRPALYHRESCLPVEKPGTSTAPTGMGAQFPSRDADASPDLATQIAQARRDARLHPAQAAADVLRHLAPKDVQRVGAATSAVGSVTVTQVADTLETPCSSADCPGCACCAAPLTRTSCPSDADGASDCRRSDRQADWDRHRPDNGQSQAGSTGGIRAPAPTGVWRISQRSCCAPPTKQAAFTARWNRPPRRVSRVWQPRRAANRETRSLSAFRGALADTRSNSREDIA
jgi:hypothetical protein